MSYENYSISEFIQTRLFQACLPTRQNGVENRDNTHCTFRLQAVPFWSVEMVRSQRRETGARRNKREETFPKSPAPLVCSSFFAALGYFAQPLDYPERDCLQSIAHLNAEHLINVTIKLVLAFFQHTKTIAKVGWNPACVSIVIVPACALTSSCFSSSAGGIDGGL